MRRGELWTAAGGVYASKPRPPVIVQGDVFELSESVTVAHLTTILTDAPLLRLQIPTDGVAGLSQISDVRVDKLTTVRRSNVLVRIGRLALCPIVEGALVRFLTRTGETQATAREILAALHATPRCDFWEDSISYGAANLGHVVGHRQVTDAYLAALAASRGGRLATFDQALAAALPEVVDSIP